MVSVYLLLRYHPVFLNWKEIIDSLAFFILCIIPDFYLLSLGLWILTMIVLDVDFFEFFLEFAQLPWILMFKCFARFGIFPFIIFFWIIYIAKPSFCSPSGMSSDTNLKTFVIVPLVFAAQLILFLVFFLLFVQIG